MPDKLFEEIDATHRPASSANLIADDGALSPGHALLDDHGVPEDFRPLDQAADLTKYTGPVTLHLLPGGSKTKVMVGQKCGCGPGAHWKLKVVAS